MSNSMNVILVFVVLIVSTVVLYNVVTTNNAQKDIEERNNVCIMLTEQLNSNLNNSDFCVDYHCYYAPYAPPEGYEGNTETLCICDCATHNGTITTTQVLNPSFS